MKNSDYERVQGKFDRAIAARDAIRAERERLISERARLPRWRFIRSQRLSDRIRELYHDSEDADLAAYGYSIILQDRTR